MELRIRRVRELLPALLFMGLLLLLTFNIRIAVNSETSMFFNVDRPRDERATTGTASMPKYYLHLWDGDLFERDQEGTNLPNLAAAREEAMKFAQQISCDLEAPDRALVEVADERGVTLWLIQLSHNAGAATRRITH